MIKHHSCLLPCDFCAVRQWWQKFGTMRGIRAASMRLLRRQTSVAKAWWNYCVPWNSCLTARAKSWTNSGVYTWQCFDNWIPASDPWMTACSPLQLHCKGENNLTTAVLLVSSVVRLRNGCPESGVFSPTRHWSKVTLCTLGVPISLWTVCRCQLVALCGCSWQKNRPSATLFCAIIHRKI